MRKLISLVTVATLGALVLSITPAAKADAQGWGDRLKKKAEEAAKRKVEERTEKRAGQAADKALDQVECAATDQACKDKKAASAAAGQGGAAGGGVTPSGTAGAGAASLKPGEGVWANYDFKPGDRIIFADDFTKDVVGDFPRRLEFREGQIEIVESASGRWLRVQDGRFFIPLPETLPDRFTLEFDLTGEGGRSLILSLVSKGNSGPHIWVSTWGSSGQAGLRSGEINAQGQLAGRAAEKPVHIAITVDGDHVKLYGDETRAFNAPNGALGRSKKIEVYAYRQMIGNLRIAAGGKKLYDALAETGRVATQGVYFDTGSDRIRPESTPTLKEIGQMLSEHADLKLTIEGHTDNVGNAAANQTLSERRAAAVKAYLVEKHGIDASRLISAGFGDKKPAAKNETPEGRQQNRRVELVKM